MVINGKQLSELDTFFAKAKLPATVLLDAGTTITDVRQFVQSHIAVLKNNMDKPIYEVFYNRLVKLKELMNSAA